MYLIINFLMVVEKFSRDRIVVQKSGPQARVARRVVKHVTCCRLRDPYH